MMEALEVTGWALLFLALIAGLAACVFGFLQDSE